MKPDPFTRSTPRVHRRSGMMTPPWRRPTRPPTETPSQTLLNRELSWLDLNQRVLDLAADPAEPLLERVKFCAIFSSNLDEFFMVRVAGLLDQVVARVNVRSPDGRTPQQALAEVRERRARADRGAVEALARRARARRSPREGIVVGTIEDATEEERAELETRFARQIYPVLTPLAVGPGQPFPYISGLSLSLGVTVRDPDSGEERFARVKVPETLPRFVAIGDRGLLIPLEGVDLALPELGLPRHGADRARRLPRHAGRRHRDLRRRGRPARGGRDRAAQAALRRRRPARGLELDLAGDGRAGCTERLAVRPDAVYPIHGLLDLRDVMQLYDLDRPDLKYEPWVPQTQRRLAKPKDGDLFAEIAAGDIVVQHPYDSFATSVEAFVRAAAKDPAVATLKTTVYRTSHDSALAPALIEAAENGKQSVCIVELKARFDERRNIEWARSLEQAGVHVVYGFPDLKIHAKTTLVIRREGDCAPALRPHRHRQLPRDDRADLRGRRAVHGRSGHLGRHRRPLQLRHRLRPPADVPQDPRRAVQPAARARSSASARSAPRRPPASTRGSGSRSTTSPTRRSSRSSTRPRRPAPRST